MKILVDKSIRLNSDEIANYKFPFNEFFSLEITENKVKYEFLIRFSSSNKNLICFGGGGIERKGPKAKKPPVFNRHSWNEFFEESVLFYNDPTLYLSDELRFGCGIGTQDVYYLEVIAKIIEKLSKKAKINPEDILFYGSSGGGFTSIQLASLIRNSTALTNNSQFILKNFNLSGHYDDILNTCFNGLTEKEVLEEYGYRLNVLKMFSKEKYIPKIIYCVNASSRRDLILQLIPFIKGLNDLPYFNDNIEIIIYYDKKDIHELLNKKKSIDWILNQHSPLTKQVLLNYKDSIDLIAKQHEPLNNKDSIDLIKFVIKNKLHKKDRSFYSYDQIQKLEKENKLLKKSLKNYKSRKIVRATDKILKILKKVLNKT